MNDYQPATIELVDNRLICLGDWTTKGIATLEASLLAGIILPTFPLKMDGSKIVQLDSGGAWLLQEIVNRLKAKKVQLSLDGFDSAQRALLELITKNQERARPSEPLKPLNPFAKVGKLTIEKINEFLVWMQFIGEFCVVSLKLIARPHKIRWKYLFSVIDMMGYRALPIVGVLSFLIGVVLAYQIGLELKIYGANIYIISFMGLSIFREFGPLITAIILAGRTSSSFTAQLGIMKINEEIDALDTMGFSPTELLTFPRIFGLILVMPLLVVWADIFGVLGGMIMTKDLLGISYHTFITLFPENVTLTSFVIGICKAPVFAMIIATVGCFHGFRVSGSSESIGWQTTKSVVLAIFMIIIADAIFSVIFSWWGI